MTGSVSREIQTPSLVTHLEFSHSLLLSGAADGYLRTHDPRTGIIHNGGSESSVKAHYSGIQGLQTVGNFVFTIGLSLRFLPEIFSVPSFAHPLPDKVDPFPIPW